MATVNFCSFILSQSLSLRVIYSMLLLFGKSNWFTCSSLLSFFLRVQLHFPPSGGFSFSLLVGVVLLAFDFPTQTLVLHDF